MITWQEKFLNITWTDFIEQAFELSQKIKNSNKQIDLIVTIARGGLTLSQLLSDSLSLPIASFTIQSYKDLRQQTLPQITFGVGGQLQNKRILLVDDVCDTGKTFLRGIEYLVKQGAKKEEVTTASLHYKPHAAYKPYFYIAETDKWIIYPYEVRETIMQLLPIWQKEEVSKQEIKQRFIFWKFPEKQILELT